MMVSLFPSPKFAVPLCKCESGWLQNHSSYGGFLISKPVWCNRKLRCCSEGKEGKAGALEVSNLAAESEEKEEDAFQVLTAMRSSYNDIVILDTPKSRMLLLDSTRNVHSIFNKGEKWTGSYWDEFATLPAVVPRGPIAILGLGGGTAAHLMLDLWPSVTLEGWEIDEILIDKAREYLGLSKLENYNQAGGILKIRIGDALAPAVNSSGVYAGIIVDLFSEGKVLPQLQEVETWLELNDRLMPHGRLMVNCGGITEANVSADVSWAQNSTLKALSKAFPGQLSWKSLPESQGQNYLALTGSSPDPSLWSAEVPSCLSTGVKQWKPC